MKQIFSLYMGIGSGNRIITIQVNSWVSYKPQAARHNIRQDQGQEFPSDLLKVVIIIKEKIQGGVIHWG